jgi:FtsZ-binding cell division protein ZapB
MLGSLQSLKQLEALVKQAIDALRRASTENRALKEKLGRLDSEHKRLKEELRAANMTLARHARLKSRLAKLSEKLERIA